MMGLDHYSVAEPDFLYVASRMKFASAARSAGNPGERRALQFGLAAIFFSVVLWTAPCSEAQQVSAALRTSDSSANGVPDAPTPLLSLAQTAAQTAGPVNPQDGKLYLSLRQAFTMELQNNLDLEVE